MGASPNRPRPQHRPAYKALCHLLKAWRTESGLTQRELAAKLKVAPSMVAKAELGDRRIDPVEFVSWCKACQIDPSRAIKKVKS